MPNAIKATPCDIAAPRTSLHHAASISFQTSVWLMRGTHCNGSTDNWGRDSSVSIVNGLWGGQIGVRFRAGRTELRLLQDAHTDSESCQASYSMDTGFFPDGNATEARCCPSTPSSAEVKSECSRNPTAIVFVHGVDWNNVTFC